MLVSNIKIYNFFRLATLMINGLIIFTILFNPNLDVTLFIDYYFFYSFIYFVVCIGLSFPFFELMTTTYTLQLLCSNIWMDRWKINSLVIYNPLENYYVTNMLYIAIFTFTTTLFMNHARLNGKLKEIIRKFRNYNKMGEIAMNLFVFGVIFTALNRLIPNIPTIKQLVNCLANLLYISIICFYFSKNPFRFVYIALISLFLITDAFRSTLLFTAFLWMFFYFLYFQIQKPWKLYVKLSLFIVVSIFLVVVQSVKQDIRKKQGLNSDLNSFSDAIAAKGSVIQENDASFKKKYLPILLTRVNQTFFDHFVFKNALKIDEGKRRPNTIKNSFLAAFVPRIFWPDKPSFDNGRLYELSGLNIRGAFISISLIAEAYINYGYEGGAFFMAFYAFCLAIIMVFIIKQSFKSIPLLILFIPYLFFNILRVEVDFTQIIYGFYSSMIFIILVFLYFRQKGFNKEIVEETNNYG
jgi:hypothetical protein